MLIRRSRGRPTLNDDELLWRRDELVQLLSVSWADIGWRLRHARTPEEVRSALGLKWGKDHLVSLFVRQSPMTVTGKELRARKKAYGKAATRTQDLQKKHEEISQLYSQIKQAITQASPDQLKELHADLTSYELELRKSAKELDDTRTQEQTLRSSVDDAQASFAQHELARIIAEKRCARNPLRLANAMAGLPLLSARVSYGRCSKLKCSGWPQFQFGVFKFIESTWKRRERYAALTTVELFDQEIKRLPRTVRRAEFAEIIAAPREKKRVDNYLRSYLGENRRYLRLAIERSLATAEIEKDRTPFVIMSNFAVIREEPRSALTQALAQRERIDK